MAGSSGMVFARVASGHGLVSRRQLAAWGRDHIRYRLRGSTDDETSELLRVARETFKGVPERDIIRLGPEVLAGILPRIYPEMLEEIHHHQDEGRATFIVSAAGNEMVAQLANVLGMEGGIGTSYQVGPDGLYNGRLNGPFVYGDGKVEAMRTFASEHEIDMDASYAYSDSVSDLPMLRSVGNAVVVNPDPELLAIARQEDWRVLKFERLGRRMAIAAGTALAAAGGTLLASRRRSNASGRLGRR